MKDDISEALGIVLETVFSDMPIILAAYGPNGLISLWSKGAELITGYTAAEMINNPKGAELLYPNPLERNEAIKLANGSAGRIFEIRCKNGKRKMISWYNPRDTLPELSLKRLILGIDVTSYQTTISGILEEKKRQAIENNRLSELLDKLLQLDAHEGIDGSRYSRREADRIGGASHLGRRQADTEEDDTRHGRRWYDPPIKPIAKKKPRPKK
ncbi:MAG TPA: hypothetical protein VLF21_00220 [Candidatus Saccharimonadales bacterium]|nr:hypothetical protein [Candidatus Saccharimonadales bacterium]